MTQGPNPSSEISLAIWRDAVSTLTASYRGRLSTELSPVNRPDTTFGDAGQWSSSSGTAVDEEETTENFVGSADDASSSNADASLVCACSNTQDPSAVSDRECPTASDGLSGGEISCEVSSSNAVTVNDDRISAAPATDDSEPWTPSPLSPAVCASRAQD